MPILSRRACVIRLICLRNASTKKLHESQRDHALACDRIGVCCDSTKITLAILTRTAFRDSEKLSRAVFAFPFAAIFA